MIELVMATAILLIIAAAVLPTVKHFAKRQKEIELHRALREIRTAIDGYHQAAVAGQIEVKGVANRESPWPPTLEILVEGADSLQALPYKVKFLRRMPRDPFNTEGDDNDEAGWKCRSYQDEPDSTSWGKQNVYDVYSSSEGRALDGSFYKDW